MVKILMVCLGNICRSPLAEGILRAKLPKEKFLVDSAGTAHYHLDSTPDSRATQVAKENQIDISNLRSRQFQLADFENFDLIYAMDHANYKHLINLAKNEKERKKINLILNESSPEQNKEVPDPYYGSLIDFRRVFDLLDIACQAIADRLTKAR